MRGHRIGCWLVGLTPVVAATAAYATGCYRDLEGYETACDHWVDLTDPTICKDHFIGDSNPCPLALGAEEGLDDFADYNADCIVQIRQQNETGGCDIIWTGAATQGCIRAIGVGCPH